MAYTVTWQNAVPVVFVSETVAHTEESNTGSGFMVNPLCLPACLPASQPAIFVFANYCVGRLGLSSSYHLVFAECLCPLRSALFRLFILQIWTDPFPEISIFSGDNPALRLYAQACAVATCCPVALSCFQSQSEKRIKVYIPNCSFEVWNLYFTVIVALWLGKTVFSNSVFFWAVICLLEYDEMREKTSFLPRCLLYCTVTREPLLRHRRISHVRLLLWELSGTNTSHLW